MFTAYAVLEFVSVVKAGDSSSNDAREKDRELYALGRNQEERVFGVAVVQAAPQVNFALKVLVNFGLIVLLAID